MPLAELNCSHVHTIKRVQLDEETYVDDLLRVAAATIRGMRLNLAERLAL